MLYIPTRAQIKFLSIAALPLVLLKYRRGVDPYYSTERKNLIMFLIQIYCSQKFSSQTVPEALQDAGGLKRSAPTDSNPRRNNPLASFNQFSMHATQLTHTHKHKYIQTRRRNAHTALTDTRGRLVGRKGPRGVT